MVRWGILGTGEMAAELVEAIRQTADGEVVAVGSRRRETADAFAAEHAVDLACGSYEELIERGVVDAVYVATTNDRHHDLTLACLSEGLAVLCEKPLALNARQAGEMIHAARSSGTFLMEAMWMRFQPAIRKLEELIAAGAIGPVRSLEASFGFIGDPDPNARLMNPALGGGALLDIGVYPLTLAYSLLGTPASMCSAAVLSESGVDAQVSVVSAHAGGALSLSAASLVADTGVEATVAGPDGRIRIHAPFHHSPLLTVHRDKRTVEAFDVSYQGSGYRFEVEEVHLRLRNGESESEIVPLDDSLAVMRWMDEVRAQIGVAYPGD